MSKTYGGLFDVDCDPHIGIILAILRQAKVDAERGDLSALAWLLTTGAGIAESITEGGADGVLSFARETWEGYSEKTRAKFRFMFER